MITLFQTILFFLFVGYLIGRFGALPSISDFFYAAKERGWKGEEHLFFVFAVSIGGLMFFTGEAWLVASGVLLSLVGGAREFREKLTGTAHVIGAVGAIVAANIGILFSPHYTASSHLMAWIGIAGITVMYLLFHGWGKRTLIIEIVAFVFIQLARI